MQGRADGGRPRLLQRRVLSPSGALQALSGAYGGPSTSAPQAVTHADSSSSGLHRMTPASGRRGSRSASPPTRARSPAVIREPLSSPPVAVRCQRCCGRAPAQTGSGRLPVLRPVFAWPTWCSLSGRSRSTSEPCGSRSSAPLAPCGLSFVGGRSPGDEGRGWWLLRPESQRARFAIRSSTGESWTSAERIADSMRLDSPATPPRCFAMSRVPAWRGTPAPSVIE